MRALVAVGTKKGLFLAHSDGARARWRMDGPYFPADQVYAVGVDTRFDPPRLLAGATSEHWGPSVFRSADLGASWTETPQGAVRFPAATGVALERVWQLQPAAPAAPGVVYAGTEPAALFRSTDSGETFALVEGLWNHPHRPDWMPGGGGLCLHTVVPHPTDPDRITIAVSTGGCYRTTDGGRTWTASNTGIGTDFLPGPAPDHGQCVHKVSMSPSRPDRLYLQNHGGVYRSDDAGQSWQPIGAGLPNDFGFPVVAHPHKPDTAYVFPLVLDDGRTPPNHRCRVYRTDDAGQKWRELDIGLPTQPHFGAVLRDAMCTDSAEVAGLYFGTRNGEVYGSADEGESWRLLAAHLPDVLCARAAVFD